MLCHLQTPKTTVAIMHHVNNMLRSLNTTVSRVKIYVSIGLILTYSQAVP